MSQQPAGYFIWVPGTRGPEPQKCLSLPVAIGNDYWSENQGRILKRHPLTPEEYAMTLEELVVLYHAPLPRPDDL